jgi:epoxyqueuosine reductase
MKPSRLLTDEVRAVALRAGVDLVGFAPPSALADAPDGTRPEQYLDGATCVISIGVHIPNGVCDVWGQPDEVGRSAGPYLQYGYGITSWEASRAAMLVARHLELEGHRSICFQPAWSSSYYRSYHRRDEGALEQDFPHQLAAVAAGLGEIGWNGLCLTPEFGARQRFASVLTDAPLRRDAPYAGPRLCDPDVCGRICSRVCPTTALSTTNSHSTLVGEREYQVADLDGVRCLFGLEGLVAGTGSRAALLLPDHTVTWSVLVSAREDRSAVDRLLISHCEGALIGHFCERCLHECPSHRADWRRTS